MQVFWELYFIKNRTLKGREWDWKREGKIQIINGDQGVQAFSSKHLEIIDGFDMRNNLDIVCIVEVNLAM